MEAIKEINGALFKDMVKNGTVKLKNNQEYVNSLNVFPVPDGDTGINMRMTIEGGYSAIGDLDDNNLSNVAKSLSKSMVLSARGNSGVILSQFFKGFYIGVDGLESVDAVRLADAFIAGYKQAYLVVKKPVEGTMLTVVREASEYAKSKMKNNSTVQDFFKMLLEEAFASLKRTPELLPVLKEAGVVDSGGVGLIEIFEGMSMLLDGKVIEVGENDEPISKTVSTNAFNADSILEYGYCTEFILQLQNAKVNPQTFDVHEITSFLETIGDSIVAFKDDDIVKVHVHTMVPGKVINFCQQFGEYVTFKMENMSIQHNEVEEKKKHEYKKYSVVSVSPAMGISEAFKKIGADEIVVGGQTMNPSANDFIEAFKLLTTDYIFVFPNNSNVILTAKQAAEAYNDAKVYVIPTKTIGECYSALTMLDYSSDDPDNIAEEFNECICNVSNCEVTYAIRDSELNGVKIHKDDFIGIHEDRIVSANKNKIEAIKEMFRNIDEMDEKEVMTIIYGKDITALEKKEIMAFLKENYPSFEIGEIDGMQDVYSLFISLE